MQKPKFSFFNPNTLEMFSIIGVMKIWHMKMPTCFFQFTDFPEAWIFSPCIDTWKMLIKKILEYFKTMFTIIMCKSVPAPDCILWKFGASRESGSFGILSLSTALWRWGRSKGPSHRLQVTGQEEMAPVAPEEVQIRD